MRRKLIHHTIYIIISALIISSFYLLYDYLNQSKQPNKSTPSENISLGNALTSYIYYTNTAGRQKELLSFGSLQRVKDPELKKFYASLDWALRMPSVEYYDSYIYTSWNPIEMNGYKKPNYMRYWQYIRPQLVELYSAKVPVVTVDSPVVHFRCSDIPFIKHSQYHLIKRESAQWMANLVKKRGYNQVILLSCNAHLTRDKNSCCQQYAAYYADIFEQNGVSVNTQCNSVLHDFALMINAPLLVTLNASSYSFMAGISKNPKNYISSQLGTEVDGIYVSSADVDWIIDQRQPLLHKDVSDYYKVADVIQLLNAG